MTQKIAISLPDPLLRMIEFERGQRGLSRSEFLRVAVQEHFDRIAEREKESAYIEAYRADPETESEVRAVEGAGLSAWADLPWEHDDQTG